MLESLPDDILTLKQKILDLSAEKNSIEEKFKNSQNKILQLENEIQDYRRILFGAKSEKMSLLEYEQYLLFNEAEHGLDDESELFEGLKESHVREHRRKGRRKISKDIPRKEIVHDVEEEEKICNCGCRMHQLPDEISENLVMIPAKLYVERHIYRRYACKGCEGDERDEAGKIILTAKRPESLLPGSILSPSLMAYVLVSKVVDHIPFYRMSKIFYRYGLEIPRATISNWVVGVYEKYKEFFSFLNKYLLKGPIIGIDETSLQVFKEAGRKNTTKSFMWVLRGGTVSKRIILFKYSPTRSAEFLKNELKDYTGFVQTDGYESYDTHLSSNENIILSECMAHVRRKFYKLYHSTKDRVAAKVLYLIKKLYEVEKQIKKLELYEKEEYQKIVEIRQTKAKPVFLELEAYLKEQAIRLPKEFGVGKPIQYALNRWEKLRPYLQHGEIYIDNNFVENAIRPFVIGRKNWMFSGSPRGAEATAFWFSFLETCKANNKEPYETLLDFLEKLPLCKNSKDCERIFSEVMGWV